jgi:ligand-binding sensor domain-containing protein
MRADPSGRVWIGTQGQGLWRSDAAVTRFERLNLPLPSPDVFSLAFLPADAPTHLYVGTDEGLARIALEKDGRPEE